MQTSKEWKVSWPRTDRSERRYSIKRDFTWAVMLYHKLIGLGHKDVLLEERKIVTYEWKEVKDVPNA